MRLPPRGKMSLEDIENMDDETIRKIYVRECRLVGRMPNIEDRYAIGVMGHGDNVPPEVAKAVAEYPRVYETRYQAP